MRNAAGRAFFFAHHQRGRPAALGNKERKRIVGHPKVIQRSGNPAGFDSTSMRNDHRFALNPFMAFPLAATSLGFSLNIHGTFPTPLRLYP